MDYDGAFYHILAQVRFDVTKAHSPFSKFARAKNEDFIMAKTTAKKTEKKGTQTNMWTGRFASGMAQSMVDLSFSLQFDAEAKPTTRRFAMA